MTGPDARTMGGMARSTTGRPADLVLEGGGVKGIGLAGAVAAMTDRGWTPHRISGTSAGCRRNCGSPAVPTTVVQTICSSGIARATSQSSGTSSGSGVKTATPSAGATSDRRSASASGVGSRRPERGETSLGYRRASPADRAMSRCAVVKANQIGLSKME